MHRIIIRNIYLFFNRLWEAAGNPNEKIQDKCGFMIHKEHSNISTTPDVMIEDGEQPWKYNVQWFVIVM